MILLADSEGPDQTAQMRRLILAHAVRIWLKTRFRMARPIYEMWWNIKSVQFHFTGEHLSATEVL